MRQTILALSPTRMGKELNTRPCNWSSPALPVSSGMPPVVRGDAGAQPELPAGSTAAVVGAVADVGAGAVVGCGVTTVVGGDDWRGPEHAATTTRAAAMATMVAR